MPETIRSPRRVIRLCDLPQFVGVQRSQIENAIKRGLLHPYSPFGGRAMVVDEDEVAALQENAKTRPSRRGISWLPEAAKKSVKARRSIEREGKRK